MRKVLLGTTALAAASMLAFTSNDVSAQTKKVNTGINVTGYMMSKLYYAEQDQSFEQDAATAGNETGYDQFNVVNDTEIHFSGRTMTDSGITVTAKVELESDQATNGGQMIDQSFMRLSGSFGQVNIGSYQKVSSLLGNVAPVVGPDVHFGGGHESALVRPTGHSANVRFLETRMDTADHVTLTYISPKLADMLFIGASIVPSTDAGNAAIDNAGDDGDSVAQYDFAIAYNGKMGGADVRADLGYGENNGNDSSNKHWRGGFRVAAGGATVGASYKTRSDTTTGQAGTANSDEVEVFDVGMSYNMGKATIGVTYAHAEAPLATGVTGGDEHSKALFGAQYDAGNGVQFRGQIAYIDYEDELTNDGNNNSGWAVVGGVRVAF